MIGTVVYISDLKQSYYDGKPYYLVNIKTADGSQFKTYLCPEYHNFKNWKPFLHEGKIVAGMVVKKGLIDADSPIYDPETFQGNPS